MSSETLADDIDWPLCGQRWAPDEPCTGVRIGATDRCLAHLPEEQLDKYLRDLNQAAGVDLRGTRLNLAMVGRLQSARTTQFGGADFRHATFIDHVDFRDMVLGPAFFDHATFVKTANFNAAEFGAWVSFQHACFLGHAYFNETKFGAGAYFGDAKFDGQSTFREASFSQGVQFDHVVFNDVAIFGEASFVKDVDLGDTIFRKDVWFDGATFQAIDHLGPLVAQSVDLSGASFDVAVVVEIEAADVVSSRTRFAGGVELRIRYGTVDLSEAFFGSASTLSTSATAFTMPTDDLGSREVEMPEEVTRRWRGRFKSPDPRPVLLSLRGADVTELALTDVDLRVCRFAGAHHLDKLRIEGHSPFPQSPRSRLWTSRQVLFEEQLWRRDDLDDARWAGSIPGALPRLRGEPGPVGPTRLASLYRSLRKALEDGKNEAGAGDFYYGEQEARRRIEGVPRAERAILWCYWLISGYGQRASRALIALAVLIGVVAAVLVGAGLPLSGQVSQSTTVVQPVGMGQRSTTTTTDVPVQLPPWSERWTWSRVEGAARIALGAVVFRDAGQKLAPAGTWMVMVARFFGPVLLALAALAVRARVKR